MLQHVVLFHFDADLPPDDEREFFGMLRAFPERIGGIDVLRVGTPMYVDRARGYQYLLYMELADEAALQHYRVHELHQAFVRWSGEHGGYSLGFDYYVDEHTQLHPPATS